MNLDTKREKSYVWTKTKVFIGAYNCLESELFICDKW